MQQDFATVMAGRTIQQLLDMLRERHEYVPEAIHAASAELQRRGVNGFDIAAAEDDGVENECGASKAADEPMPLQERIFWLVLPFLALTPLGRRQFHRYTKNGHRRMSMQFLETVFIGFSMYVLSLIGYQTLSNFIAH